MDVLSVADVLIVHNVVVDTLSTKASPEQLKKVIPEFPGKLEKARVSAQQRQRVASQGLRATDYESQ